MQLGFSSLSRGSLVIAIVAMSLAPAAELLAEEKPRSIPEAPPRAEGEGPFQRLILRGGILIDGTGAPAIGPVDIIVEGNRIVRVQNVGVPGVEIDAEGRPQAGPDDHELNIEGMYILPGFVDMHGHIGGVEQGTPAEYVFKLWMGHGVTTVRDPGSGNGLDWVKEHQAKSERNEITAPRIHPYLFFGAGREEPFTTPEQAREWVRETASRGARGIKFFGAPPAIIEAALDEAKKQGLGSACHHAQMAVTRVHVLDTARWGLTSMEHWYGLPEALFTDQTVQDYPLDYNYANELDRFGQAGKLWKQAAPRGSERWYEVMDELIELDFTIDPTFTPYEANRDLMRIRGDEWHEKYTLPSLWRFFAPNRENHASYWYYWTTADEIAWKENFRLWMTFVNEFKNRGGRVTTGSDSGYIYKIYGFGYIRELELLQEAGFHPLEVIRAATLNGAEALGEDDQIGSIEPGKLADMVIVDANPLENLKVLYGTGAIKLDENNEVVRVGGVRYTIKDGIVFDAPKLLGDVREIVQQAKDAEGFTLTHPGLDW
jgi:hypothetical protein